MTTTSPGDDLGAARLLRDLTRTVYFLQRRSTRDGCGHGVAQCHALTTLARCGEMTLGQLVDWLRLDKAWISRTVKQLETDGLLQRRTRDQDRRVTLLRLSAAGRDVAARIERTLDEEALRLLRYLDDCDRNGVADSLKKLSDAAEKALDDD